MPVGGEVESEAIIYEHELKNTKLLEYQKLLERGRLSEMEGEAALDGKEEMNGKASTSSGVGRRNEGQTEQRRR